MIAEESINLLDKKLQARGIWEPAQDLGWHISGSGWRYRVYDCDGEPYITRDGRALYRWKNQDSSARPKYAWEPKETDRPIYYTIPGLRKAIADAGGSIYLASGEPDVLAFYAAGMKNVLCWFGEQSVPATLADDLRERGVIVADCYPDLDDTGRRWAEKIATVLEGSGIKLRVSALPADLGEKGDINKLWQACKFNADDFAARLVSLPEIEVKREPPKPKVLQLPDNSEPPPGLWQEIERRAGVSKYNGKGWSDLVRCPFDQNHQHDEKQPAFALSKETWSSKCPKCAPTWGWKATAEAYGIRVADFIQKPTYDVRQAAPEPPKTSANGVKPDTLRNERYKPISIDEMAARPPEIYLAPEIPAASLGMLVGESGAGKSFVARDYALAVGNTVYVAAEGAAGTADRFIAARNHYKRDDSLVRIIDTAVPLLDGNEVQAFIQAVQPLAPKLIIFDTLARCMLGGDENSARDAGLLVAACDTIKRAIGATVLLVHHTGKSGTSERGSSAFKAACDFVIKLTNEDGLITLSSDKSKDAKPFENRYLRMVEAPAREGHTSIVLLPAANVRHSASDPLSQQQRQVLEALALETFVNTGAKFVSLKSVVNIGDSSLYRALSTLIRRDYVRQDSKGDPYRIVGAGLDAIGKREAINLS